MPCKLRLTLAGPAPASPYQHLPGLHRLVLEWVGLANPELAAASHDGRKPYTVSPLWPAPGHAGRFQVTIGALADGAADILRQGIERYGPTIGLGPQQYQLEQVSVEDEVSWAELAQTAPVSSAYQVRLLSPTRATEPEAPRKAAPPPCPEGYLASIAQWNRGSPDGVFALDESVVTFAAEAVQLAACQVRVESLRHFGGVFVGYVGEVTFEVLEPRRIGPAYLHALAALARFANYCGTGKGTAAGMGQTECRSLLK